MKINLILLKKISLNNEDVLRNVLKNSFQLFLKSKTLYVNSSKILHIYI